MSEQQAASEKKIKVKKSKVAATTEQPPVPAPVPAEPPAASTTPAVKKAKKVKSEAAAVATSSEAATAKKAPKEKKAKKVAATPGEAQAPVPPPKGSKTTTANIDYILQLLISKFGLDEKEVRSVIGPHVPTTSKFNKKGKKKDKNEPKKALSSYIFFTNENRDKLLKEQPELKFIQVTKELGKRWKAISEDEKRKYEDMSAKDKERHARELAEYKNREVVAAVTATA
jgi:hypothetical protein